jgi:hypothetical protein
MRGAGDGLTVVAPLEGAAVHQREPFTWHAVSDASSYTLEVVSQQGDPVYLLSTADTTVVLPDSVRTPPGASWRWWVTATRSDGTEVRSSTRVLHANPQ